MRSLSLQFRFAVCALALLAATLGPMIPARAQLYVADVGAELGSGSIGSFSLSGGTLDGDLVPSVVTPLGLALSGNTLFVADSEAGVVSAHDATTGSAVGGFSTIFLSGAQGVAVADGSLFVLGLDSEAAPIVKQYSLAGALINDSLIQGLGDSGGIAVGGGFIYITDQDSGTIGKYTLGGVVVSASFISGLSQPVGLTFSDGNIYVADFAAGTVGVFDSLTGAGNSSLISGLSSPSAVAVAEGHIYVADFHPGTVGKYRQDGSVVDAAFLSGLDGPTAVAAVPEPGTKALVGTGLLLLAAVRAWKGCVRRRV